MIRGAFEKPASPPPFADEVDEADGQRAAGENRRIDKEEAVAPDVAAGEMDRVHRLQR